MFNTEIYRQRRSTLKSKVEKGIILLLGNDEVGMSYEANVYRFRQDSSFLYYTGIDAPSLAFVIDIDEDKEILFGNEATIDDIVWTGPTEALHVKAAKAGITEVKPYKEIESLLKDAVAKNRTVHFLPPYRGEHILKLHTWLGITPAEVAKNVSEKLIKSIVSMRSYKQPDEIMEMEKAVDISTKMHQLFLSSIRQEISELEIAGQIEGLAISLGGSIAYPVILTTNGETLHINPRNVLMKDGQLVLCDAGAETAMHYAGDITRTRPVSSMFSSVQKDMYNLILKIQLATIAACKPNVPFRDVHALAGEMLLEGLKGFGIVKGDVQEALVHNAHTLFFQCGLGHMIGLDVHDMENLGEEYVGYSDDIKRNMAFGWKSLRLAKPLERGFTLTVEPGIYFIPTLIDLWKSQNKLSDFINYTELEKFRNFGGIRIEDNILITEDAPYILGHTIAQKTVDEIEALA
ncbi:Xaa-Pro aminopeptidase [Arachidicoccus ginsenosidimutans]|uniref:aminopeptidase P family protein n=1 Tax=Arachidicoccus sp. BS20 TaxID=1850526 RepID=UPI0007F0D562|nr:aminopeptidase P family protein [Arachidicoccus sp. BS20]ANI89093.1 Xaa-Pro aminopeptidase [Arachidicoccus sp. BS20]